MTNHVARILVLCKTYPSPSEKHIETSCVAGLHEETGLVRLFPVPFRLISDGQQFKKWQWIEARIAKATSDRRPESHKVFVDTISCDEDPISTSGNWINRRNAISNETVFQDFDDLEEKRKLSGITLGLLKPSKVLGLEITPVKDPEWTDSEKQKLVQNEKQIGLFEESDKQAMNQLRKLPFSFHYSYECEFEGARKTYRHKIVDWEIGALFWNCRRNYGNDWEIKFRQKMEVQLPAADLIFLMGTIHRFPDQWLIVSLIYPPKIEPDAQLTLV